MDLFQQELVKELVAERGVKEIRKAFRNTRHFNTILRSYNKFYPAMNASDTYEPIIGLLEKTSSLGEYLYKLRNFVASSPLRSSLDGFNNINLYSNLDDVSIKDLTDGNIEDISRICMRDIKHNYISARSLLSGSFQAGEIDAVIEMIDDIIQEIDAI